MLDCKRRRPLRGCREGRQQFSAPVPGEQVPCGPAVGAMGNHVGISDPLEPPVPALVVRADHEDRGRGGKAFLEIDFVELMPAGPARDPELRGSGSPVPMGLAEGALNALPAILEGPGTGGRRPAAAWD